MYTRAIYERFSKELFKSGKFGCAQDDADGFYRVVLLDNVHLMDNGVIEFRVGSSPDSTDFFCQCKRFEHSGLPCRRILKVFNLCRIHLFRGCVGFFFKRLRFLVQVLVHYGFQEIPPGLLLKRWTREAKFGVNVELEGVVAEQRAAELDFAGMHSLAYAASMELVGLAAKSRQAFEVAMQYFLLVSRLFHHCPLCRSPTRNKHLMRVWLTTTLALIWSTLWLSLQVHQLHRACAPVGVRQKIA